MRLSYSYPTSRTVARLNRHLREEDELTVSDYLDIYEIVDHMSEAIGTVEAAAALGDVFPELGSTQGMTMAGLKSALELFVVGAESRKLSPGSMSNAPDRLDGFNTYNLCCRSKQDTGRSIDNLKTYGVDRRAFEFWSEGDWEAANLLMSRVTRGTCPRCGRFTQLTADHIGPISLGFQHMPVFDAVCASCNSAKNNRMSHADVARLVQLEAAGLPVASWHAVPLWAASHPRVTNDASALRLSKLMNVNQHEFLRLLVRVRVAGAPDALLQFLSPGFAEERVEFVGLDRLTLRYDRIDRRPRQRTYALGKASRLIRIAFEALDEYARKPKRNIAIVPAELLVEEQAAIDAAVARARADSSDWREPLVDAINAPAASVRENRLKELIGRGTYEPDHDFTYVRTAFEGYMTKVGEILAARLDDVDAIKLWETALAAADAPAEPDDHQRA